MIEPATIETERLIFDAWTDTHRDAATAMNADPQVMRYFMTTLSPAETRAQIDRQIATLAARGFCFWPVVRRADGVFLGIAGLKDGAEGTPVEGEREIGWRFARHAWGHGYATEAARAVLARGFADPAVSRIAAITNADNAPSWRLMERLGMARRHDLDFDHPAFPVGHPVRPHVTWFIERP